MSRERKLDWVFGKILEAVCTINKMMRIRGYEMLAERGLISNEMIFSD